MSSSNKKYNFEITKVVNFTHGNKKSLKITRKDNKNIQYDEIRHIYDGFMEKVKREKLHCRIHIIGLNIQHWTTLKSLDGDIKTDEEYDDYYINKVENVDKFEYFSQIIFDVITSND